MTAEDTTQSKNKTKPEHDFDKLRSHYFDKLVPLFRPNPQQNDIVDFLGSILRIVGMEDGGWDPYLESRKILEDLNSLLKIDLPPNSFPDQNASRWRLGLLFYSHIVEMDAVYEVLANLLRYHLGEKYSPNPFYKYLTEKQKKLYSKKSLPPKEKIFIIKDLGQRLALPIGELFEEFYNNKLRNPIAHSDYILTETDFRCRTGTGATKAYRIPLEQVEVIILKTKAFYSAFFGAEHAARTWIGAQYGGKAIPYDFNYKGLLEIIVNEDGLMSGFKVHWPNASESTYIRAENKIQMTNMFLGKDLRLELFVDLYARNPGKFSPLVEADQKARYSALSNGSIPVWPNDL